MANMDGTVVIGTKIDTKNADKGIGNIQESFEDLSISAKKVADAMNEALKDVDANAVVTEVSDAADKIEEAFDNIDVSDAADGVSESFETETKEAAKAVEEMAQSLPESYRTIYQKIEKLRSDDALDQESKVKKISELYEILGQNHEDAEKHAWKAVKAEAEEGSKDVIKNLERIGAEATEAGDEVKQGLGGKLSSAFRGLSETLQSGIIGGLTGMVSGKLMELAADAGRALVEFGKESIELGSDLQEAQNVVDVTFSTMSDSVDEFAKNAAKSAGLSQTTAKKYVGTFGAMAKSFGFTEKEAYDMSTSLTQLTGDVASFYNLDHDEAYTKLKSVFTGETESLKDLGVVMTQTALDSYALEQGINKTTSEMTEQEKVALRYQFVMAQLDGASGDFVRTQDSWANQTRILSLQWESFMASIGEGLIAVFTPALQFIIGVVMPALNTVADAFADALTPDPADDLAASLDALGIEMGETIVNAQGVEVSHEELSQAIEATEKTVKALGEEYEAARKEAKESIDDQIGLFDELAKKSEKSAREIVDNWNEQQEALRNYSENMQKAIDMGLDEALVKQLSDGSEQSMLILDELVNSTDVSIGEINREYQELGEVKETVSATMADVQTGMSKRLAEMEKELEEEWGDMAGVVGESVYEMQDYIDSLKGKTVYIDLVTREKTSGDNTSSSWTDSIFPSISGYSLDTAAIPQLANGAVIPPNAPFAAILGDQRNGTNIEAPLSTIQEALRAELGNSELSRIAELLELIYEKDTTIELDGDKVGRTVTKYQRRASRSGGY